MRQKFELFLTYFYFSHSSVKRPDQVFNQKPTLGSKRKNREGYHYHYQPIASTSRQSPTFIIDADDFDQDDDDELIIPIGPGHKFA